MIVNSSKLPIVLEKNYLDVFIPTNAKKLALHKDIDLAIEIQPRKELLYRLIYLLLLIELEVLKEYIQENLAKGFIRESKSLVATLILFALKKDRSL